MPSRRPRPASTTWSKSETQKRKRRSNERRFRLTGAGNETRTRDPDLGKVVLYQLSYSRVQQKVASPRGLEPLLPP